MATTSTAMPTGAKLKNPNPSKPEALSSSCTTIFGVVAMSVSMPLMSAAYDIGINMREEFSLVSAAMRNTIGIKMATTAVELITEPNIPAPAIIRINS